MFMFSVVLLVHHHLLTSLSRKLFSQNLSKLVAAMLLNAFFVVDSKFSYYVFLE